jgi:hypothetical protein
MSSLAPGLITLFACTVTVLSVLERPNGVAVPRIPCKSGVTEIAPCDSAVDTVYRSTPGMQTFRLSNNASANLSYELSCTVRQPFATCTVYPSSAEVFGFSSIDFQVQYSVAGWPGTAIVQVVAESRPPNQVGTTLRIVAVADAPRTEPPHGKSR